MKISGNKLQGDATRKVVFTASPNKDGKFKAGLPDTVIIHFTAGRDAASAVKSLVDPQNKASAHLVVGRDGSITQLVPFDEISWHAGVSAYDGRTGFNQFAIGIEIDNAGRLEKQGEKYFSWFGREYPREEVVEAVHRNESEPGFWHRYQEREIALVQEICGLLIPAYGIKFILGHEEVAPGRKTDPGPAFPLDRLRDKLLNTDRSQNQGLAPDALRPLARGIVTANVLNIRREPLASAPKTADPLVEGAAVTILAEKAGWYYVAAECRGWVSAEYVKKNRTPA